MSRVRFASSFAALATIALSSSVHAAEFRSELPPSGIYGGQPAGVCEWPSAVFLGGCTGTLVHPEVVIYASHCGASFDWAWFGEDSNQDEGRYVSTEFCSVIPGGQPGSGNDFAVCKLAEPVDDVPIVPPLMGCETDVLQPGVDVWLVGFGDTDTGQYGVKYEVEVQLQYIENDEAFLGGNGLAPCYGDSGGPAYVQLPADIDPEQSWRVFGITSWGGECGGGGYYSMMHNGMEWFESETGIDITPCHDADGTWNPGPSCGSFPLDPGTGVGSWPACGSGPVSGVGASCGDAGPDPSTDDGGGEVTGHTDTGDGGVDTSGAPPSHTTDDPSASTGASEGVESGGGLAEGGTTSDDDDGGGMPALPPGLGQSEGAQSCACTASTRVHAAWWLAAFAIATMRRRRRQ